MDQPIAVEEPAAAAPPRRKRRATEVLAALSRPKVGVMLALGFSSGLPFMLIGNTLGLWLAEDHIKLALIGFVSWIQLTYSVKFIWGAVVDRLPAPLAGALGRRRGWMLITQIVVAAGLLGMAAADPRSQLPVMIGFGLLAGVGAASQDTVIDAWRIEIAADADELGLLTSAYSLGFRAALVATEALILLLATAVGWPLAYAIYAGLMVVGVIATLLAREPERADAATEAARVDPIEAAVVAVMESGRVPPARAALDAVVGPFVAFFRSHGLAMGALMLATITLYHLCDYMRGPMSLPFYHALGISKPTIAAVRASLGLGGSLAGIALGGLASLRLGIARALIVGAILQPIGIAAFALMAFHGGDYVLFSLGPAPVTAFAAIMTFDAVAIGFSGVALVAYMSSLTSLGYTATQYALLTSALTWSGKFLKGFSGAIVENLQHGRSLLEAYGLFYVFSGAIGLPAILLCIWLATVQRPKPGLAAAPAE
ncbi:MAG TPA: MFS transporter [Caulobacteraceae bacterium]|jgi:PAT family beta-lactamase induction signal transducer AmpG